MFHIVFASIASHHPTKPELKSLLEETRDNHAQLGVTGMLLYKDGTFLHVLEGDEEVVMKLVTTMGKEGPGHKSFRILLSGTSEQRLFPNWSMAFRDHTDNSLTGTPGFSDFLNTPFTGTEFSANPALCMRILLGFKRSR
jgi:hypothetical protein